MKILKPGKRAKIKIEITRTAAAKISSLMFKYETEVGWECLMKEIGRRRYLIYDVLVYPQIVCGVRTTDPTTTNDWVESLTDEQLNNRRCWGHSHVWMSTSPSLTDWTTWNKKIANLCGAPFYLFQIWNKNGDVNSFFYDGKLKKFFTNKQISFVVVDDIDNTIKTVIKVFKFLNETDKMVIKLEDAKDGFKQIL